MLSALVCMATLAAPSRHAVLISFPVAGDPSPANDCALIKEALLRAGWKQDEIEVRSNPAVQELKQIEARGYDSLLVFVSGKGTFDAARLMPIQSPAWSWKEAAQTPPSGRYAFLVDTGHANLLSGLLSPNASAIVPDATWRDTTQARRVITVVHNGVTMEVGIVSYVLAREIPFASDLQDLAYRVNKTRDSGSMAAIWAELPRLKVMGSGTFPIR